MSKQAEDGHILFIVGAVAVIAIFVLLSQFFDTAASITGSVVIDQRDVTLCRDSDGNKVESNPKIKGVVTIFPKSQYPDQCYDDKTVSVSPVNNGQYLRETVCVDNEITYKVYDCGANSCQYGACVKAGYVVVK